jgi:hypothetical protein
VAGATEPQPGSDAHAASRSHHKGTRPVPVSAPGPFYGVGGCSGWVIRTQTRTITRNPATHSTAVSELGSQSAALGTSTVIKYNVCSGTAAAPGESSGDVGSQ